MHVAFVLPRFYPYRGGYENSVLALSKRLIGRGHRVTVFTTVADDLEAFWLPGFKTFPEEQITVDGVKVRRFPICYSKTCRRASRLLGMLPIGDGRRNSGGLRFASQACTRRCARSMPTSFTSALYRTQT